LVDDTGALLCKAMVADSASRAMNTVIPELETHNVFLASEFQDSFDAIFKRQSIPKEPSFYVNVPSRIDPSAAPEGKDSVVVLVQGMAFWPTRKDLLLRTSKIGKT
jgi:phytoene dehydrogenase-like protein